MKSYKEITESVLKRRDEYFKAKKRRRALLIKTASSVMGTAAAAVIGLMIYNNSILQNIKPDRYSSRYTTTEAVATAPAHPAQTETNETVTTKVRRTDDEHTCARIEKTSVTTTAPEETKSTTAKKTAPVTETKPPAIKTSSIENKTTSRVQTYVVTTIVSHRVTQLTDAPSTTENHYGGGTERPPMETAPPIETYATTVISTNPQFPAETGSISTCTVTTSPCLTGAFVTSVTMACTTTTTTVSVTETAFPDTETTTTPIDGEIPAYTTSVIYYDNRSMSRGFG